MVTPPPAPNTKCHYHSCAVVSSDVSRIKCYSPGCDRVFHSYCYSQGVLVKHDLKHFDDNNSEHPFFKIACKKGCYPKASRHHSNMSIDPECRNIPWNCDGRDGSEDPNNSENILIAWLRHPGNYNKFRSPPSGKTKLVVCEDVCKKINAANTFKTRNASSVLMKIKYMESCFRDAHDWVNNTGVGVRERDGQATFEDAVKKRFVYYYNSVDVMSERSSSRPTSTTDKRFRTMLPLSMHSHSDDDEDEDNPATEYAKDLEAKVATTAKDVEEGVEEDSANASKDVESPTYKRTTYKSTTYDTPRQIVRANSTTILDKHSTNLHTTETTT